MPAQDGDPVTTARVSGGEPIITGRPVGPVVLWGITLLVIASILVCLPAFHSATGLHRLGGTLDAFDQGINAPETTQGSLAVVMLSALLLAGLWHERASRVPSSLTRGLTRQAAARHPVWRRTCSTRLLRRAGLPRRESDDDATRMSTGSMFLVATTPRIPVNARGAEGFLVALWHGAFMPITPTGRRTQLMRE